VGSKSRNARYLLSMRCIPRRRQARVNCDADHTIDHPGGLQSFTLRCLISRRHDSKWGMVSGENGRQGCAGPAL